MYHPDTISSILEGNDRRVSVAEEQSERPLHPSCLDLPQRPQLFFRVSLLFCCVFFHTITSSFVSPNLIEHSLPHPWPGNIPPSSSARSLGKVACLHEPATSTFRVSSWHLHLGQSWLGDECSRCSSIASMACCHLSDGRSWVDSALDILDGTCLVCLIPRGSSWTLPHLVGGQRSRHSEEN